MTATESIREAARLMRERAKGAEYKTGRFVVDVAGPLASTAWLGPSHDVLTATWPQALHVDAIAAPVVALAVADWLDAVAEGNGVDRHALAVARAYLDEGA